MESIGKVAAIENKPSTIEEFYFWTDKKQILKPFDVVKVAHIENSVTFGVIEEISHITDTPSFLSSYISSDFGDVETQTNTVRIGMNYVKARVVGNSRDIYIPVLDGSLVSFANQKEVQMALGLDRIKNRLACGYLEMYEKEDRVKIPVHVNAKFLIGPEGAHLNISGISGLAAKTSYTMFLLKAIQQRYMEKTEELEDDSVALVIFNVKGKDLLAIDEPNEYLNKEDRQLYQMLNMDAEPFQNVQYFYPYSSGDHRNTYHSDYEIAKQKAANKAFHYKYIYEEDKANLDLILSNIDDPNQTMDSILNFIIAEQGGFGAIRDWGDFKKKVGEYCNAGQTRREIAVTSWRKFKRVINKPLRNGIFANRVSENNNEVRLQESISNIKKNDVFVIDIAKLDEGMQSFVFGDAIRAVYDLKLGQADHRHEADIPNKIVIFIDELNKYASTDVPKNSPILRQIIDITERGRSLGIVLFSAEQFKSAIHDRVKGNCSTHAYGRTNAIEVSKGDYRYIPKIYKGMMTRLKQGEYIIQNPVFRSLLNIKFPHPVYRQFK